MPSLNLQTDREIRYEQRCQKRKIEQQKKDRVTRFQNRENVRNNQTTDTDMNEISSEVRNAISEIAKKRHFTRQCANKTTCYFL